MIKDFTLAWRLTRGGGAGGAIRLALMTMGYALGVAVLLALATIPTVLSKRGEVTASRQPIMSEESDSALVALNFGSWRGARLTRVLVSVDSPGATPPPGVSRLPSPGEVVLSPQAKTLAGQDPDFARLVAGTVIGEIARDGLLGPDELYAYIGTASDEIPGASPCRGWGGFSVDQTVRDQFSHVPLELLILVAAPALVYLNVCARLSAATRRTRYAALRLIGMSRQRILRVAVLESVAPSLLGALIGLAAYQGLNALIGPSGVLGFSWYSQTSAVSATVAVVAVLALSVTAATIGGLNAGRALAKPVEARFDPADRPPRWWYAAPFALGLGLLSYPLLAPRDDHAALGVVPGVLLIAGVVLSAGGLLLAVRPLLVTCARAIATGGLSLPMRVAARRVEYESSGLSRYLAGLCAPILVATLGAAVLRQAELAAAPTADQLHVQVNAQDVPSASLGSMSDVPAQDFWTVHPSVTTPGSSLAEPNSIEDYVRLLGVGLLVATCETIRRDSGRPHPDCVDGTAYRVGDETTTSLPLPAGMPITYERADGTAVIVEVPEASIDLFSCPGMPFDMTILVTGTDPVGPTSDSFLYYRLSSQVTSLEEFMTAFATIAPAATLSVFDLDLDSLEAYRVHRGVIEFGTLLAFALGLAAFLISAAGRTVERRRTVASLVVVGAPGRTLRAIQRYQIVGPLIPVLTIALIVGHMAGNSLLRLQGDQVGWYTGTLRSALPMTMVSLVAALIAGSVVIGTRLRAEDLRRE